MEKMKRLDWILNLKKGDSVLFSSDEESMGEIHEGGLPFVEALADEFVTFGELAALAVFDDEMIIA